jgi:hypothetical protein
MNFMTPRPDFIPPGGLCGGSGDGGLSFGEMARVMTIWGERMWLIKNTVDQALLAISEQGLEENLPMEAARDEMLARSRKAEFQIFPHQIDSVITKRRVSWRLYE